MGGMFGVAVPCNHWCWETHDISTSHVCKTRRDIGTSFRPSYPQWRPNIITWAWISSNIIYNASVPKVKTSLPLVKRSLLHCHACVAHSFCIRPVHSPQLGLWNITSGSAVKMWMVNAAAAEQEIISQIRRNFCKRRRLYKMLKYEQGKVQMNGDYKLLTLLIYLSRTIECEITKNHMHRAGLHELQELDRWSFRRSNFLRCEPSLAWNRIMVWSLFGYLFGTYMYLVFISSAHPPCSHRCCTCWRIEGYKQARPQATTRPVVTLADRVRSNCNDIDPGLVTG